MRTLLAFAASLLAGHLVCALPGVGSGLAGPGLIGSARAAEYLETFAADKDPEAILAGTLLLGRDGAWQGELRDGAYLLSNGNQPGGVRYFHLRQRQDSTPSEVTISVDVEGTFDGPVAGAGLLYDFAIGGQGYFAFVLGRGGQYAVWRRGPEGFKRVAGGTHDAIRDGGVNLLSAHLVDERAELSINGASIVSHKVDQAREGAVGIIALDTGAYRFDNFRYAVQ